MATPGVVVVFTELGTNTDEAEYHEMYEREYCPPRMALPGFVQGVRYRAADALKPTWAGLFHVSDVAVVSFDSPALHAITARRSEREARISADYAAAERRLYRLVYDSHSGPDDGDAPVGSFLLTLALTHPDPSEIEKWYNGYHSMMRAVPGWIRSRRYLLVGGQRTGPMFEGKQGGIPTILTLHEWSSEDAFASEEFERVIHGDPRREAMLKASTDLERRILKVHKVL